MRLLLDTHILLWALLTPTRLTRPVRDALIRPANALHISVASIWEIAIKRAIGRVDAPVETLPEALDALGIALLPIAIAHALAAAALPRHHTDPFDRMLVAQARHEGLTLVTEDAALRRYDVAIFA